MNNQLLKLSQQVKNEADLLLQKTQLLDFLKKYGKVYIRGGYELDLMVNNDIDIYVVNKNNNKELSIKALNKLILANKFRGYMFYDFVKRRKQGFPKGYYLGLRTKFNQSKWSVDIWFIKSMDTVSNRFMKKVKAGLDENKRLKILNLKKIIKDKKIDLPSFVIYNAVIENDVSNYKQLCSYINRNQTNSTV